ncbi:MAG: hypothetical protein MI924_12575 [Chloroflexales bacterium]|nr:hypothetical protein [Chloroflexales bacterium]
MDVDWMIPVFVLIDTLRERVGHQSEVRAQAPDSEVILIAIAAATYVQHHHEWAVCILRESRYRSGRIAGTRFKRRRHKLADGREVIARPRGAILCTGAIFVIASRPGPVWRHGRARRGTKVRARASCGYCAAKKEQFFGWRMHLIGTPHGIPVSFQ